MFLGLHRNTVGEFGIGNRRLGGGKIPLMISF